MKRPTVILISLVIMGIMGCTLHLHYHAPAQTESKKTALDVALEDLKNGNDNTTDKD